MLSARCIRPKATKVCRPFSMKASKQSISLSKISKDLRLLCGQTLSLNTKWNVTAGTSVFWKRGKTKYNTYCMGAQPHVTSCRHLCCGVELSTSPTLPPLTWADDSCEYPGRMFSQTCVNVRAGWSTDCYMHRGSLQLFSTPVSNQLLLHKKSALLDQWVRVSGRVFFKCWISENFIHFTNLRLPFSVATAFNFGLFCLESVWD